MQSLWNPRGRSGGGSVDNPDSSKASQLSSSDAGNATTETGGAPHTDANPSSQQTGSQQRAGTQVAGASTSSTSNQKRLRPSLLRNTSQTAAPPPPASALPPPPPSAATQLPTQVQQPQQQQQQQQQPGDSSLSLAQLRRMVADFPRSEPAAYLFDYDDCAGPADEEIDEWFSYQFWQWVRLNSAQKAWEAAWEVAVAGTGAGRRRDKKMEIVASELGVDDDDDGHGMLSWDQAGEDMRRLFVRQALEVVAARRRASYEMDAKDVMKGSRRRVGSDMSAARDSLSSLGGLGTASAAERSAAIGRIMYLVLGRWADTAVFSSSGSSADTDTMDGNGSGGGSGGKRRTAATAPHRAAMTEGVRLLADLGGLSVIWAALRAQFELFWSEDPQQLRQGSLQEAQDDLMNLMTIVYVALVETLADPEPMAAVREKLLALGNEASDDKEGHSLVHFMLKATTRLRWDEAGHLPQTQIFLLFWKSILLAFGGMPEVEQAKREMAEMRPDSADADVKASNVITASPLDYHVFRQEIVSKYPAYVPPRPILPLEAESTTFLPPLPNQPMRSSAQSGIVSDGPNGAGIGSGGTSILHQPVHIATPAPSPPPSPGVGGKGGKKQNYQTNQNFPFLYPPLDASSNGVGGKGAAAQQDALVGRRWEGSDVPASILEAGALFSKRVRMTRATRQLWDEREAFLKYERGWDEGDDEDVDDFDLDELTLEERELIGKLDRPKKKQADKHQEPKIDCGPNPDLVSEATRKRLLAVEKFYEDALPQLQSLVIVLLKSVLANVTALITQAAAGQQHPLQYPLGNNAGRDGNARLNGGAGLGRSNDGGTGLNGSPDAADLSNDELDAARTREITQKAVTGILLLLLKWLKVSHVLKFEYMTQLLLDSNYLPLVLKLFAHQDIQQVVDSRTDRLENSFFTFCNLRATSMEQPTVESAAVQPDGPEPAEDSEDDAAPPPIKRRRSPVRQPTQASDATGPARKRTPPEVDELGYPVNEPPKEPITDFSRRNFFSLINYLRVMQKICKNKAHRNLLLVQYKSSNILRKSLKVPQPELRLYTLKLFKNQVPYCGRKWRQGNMRVITAVYLHCRPELRDEWLAGSDVDAAVDDALPLEQALRSLTHWFNVRHYPLRMAAVAASTGGGSGRKAHGGIDDGETTEGHGHMADDLLAGSTIGNIDGHRDFFARELEKLDLSYGFGNQSALEGSVSGDDVSDGNYMQWWQ